jgi:hypothetical protein
MRVIIITKITRISDIYEHLSVKFIGGEELINAALLF